ncbi:MAG: hypothetical protein HYS05_13840 [Acidobacteria bacterium]|nr:hypothetical protein [Acidobacteriota bacterium]
MPADRGGTRSLVGQIPDPHELYGREQFIEHLWRMLQANNVMLLAPRRFGKSGIMRHVLLKPASGFFPIALDLEDVDSNEEFVWRVTRELLVHDTTRAFLARAKRLPSMAVDWVKDTFDEVGFEGAKVKFKAAIGSDWKAEARSMLTELEKADQTIVFLFDELPKMLDRIVEKQGESAARDFLGWFRTVRLAPKDVLRRHRFVVAGSVGIDQILRRLGAVDTLVDFARLALEPLDDATAEKLVQDLAVFFALGWSPDLSRVLFELLGPPVPYFIHLFFAQLAQLPPDRRAKLTTTDLKGTYANRLLGPTCRHYLGHYSDRLRRYGVRREKAAFAILRAVAAHGRVTRPSLYEKYRRAHGRGATEEGFDDVIADLQTDWYVQLDPETNEFHFRLKVMRDWWTRWYPPESRRRLIAGKRGQP